MKRRRMTGGAALILLGIIAAGSPAAGDWLLTRAGGRVETKGLWQVKGKLVVFTQADGSLGSLRLADVDLDASRKATAEATEARVQAGKPPAPEPPKKKRTVLTDESFRKSPTVTAAVVAPPDEQEGAQPLPPGTSGPVTVSSWKQADGPKDGPKGGLEIQGTLHNTTDHLIVNAAVEVQLYDEAGESLGSASGVLSASTIQPWGTIDFRATFPGPYTVFAKVEFKPQGLPLDTGPGGPGGPGEPKPEDSSPPR